MTITDKQELARMIDHTLLKPTASQRDIVQLCREARDYGFAAVCVHPFYVKLAAGQLQGTGIPVCAVVGFPLGSNTTAAKAREAGEAVHLGAREIDMVLNIGALKERRTGVVVADIRAVVEAAAAAARDRESSTLVKVIIETCFLEQEEKIMACQLVRQAGAHFVKTSTGFGDGGATVEDVTLLRQTVGPALGIKAAGGIKTAGQAVAMIKAGANRIGASAGVAIMQQLV